MHPLRTWILKRLLVQHQYLAQNSSTKTTKINIFLIKNQIKIKRWPIVGSLFLGDGLIAWIVRWAIVQTKNKEKFRYIQFNEILGQILFFSLFITRAKS